MSFASLVAPGCYEQLLPITTMATIPLQAPIKASSKILTKYPVIFCVIWTTNGRTAEKAIVSLLSNNETNNSLISFNNRNQTWQSSTVPSSSVINDAAFKSLIPCLNLMLFIVACRLLRSKNTDPMIDLKTMTIQHFHHSSIVLKSLMSHLNLCQHSWTWSQASTQDSQGFFGSGGISKMFKKHLILKDAFHLIKEQAFLLLQLAPDKQMNLQLAISNVCLNSPRMHTSKMSNVASPMLSILTATWSFTVTSSSKLGWILTSLAKKSAGWTSLSQCLSNHVGIPNLFSELLQWSLHWFTKLNDLQWLPLSLRMLIVMLPILKNLPCSEHT